MGHACGVRVDGAAPRGFLRFLSLTALRAEGCGGGFAADFKKRGAADAAGCVEGLRCYRLGGDSACGAEGGGLPSRAMFIKSALRDLLPVSYSMISILVISRYAAAPDFHLKVKRLTMICASLALLQIMFAVHPQESVSHDSQVALLPYESCSLATPMQGAE